MIRNLIDFIGLWQFGWRKFSRKWYQSSFHDGKLMHRKQDAKTHHVCTGLNGLALTQSGQRLISVVQAQILGQCLGSDVESTTTVFVQSFFIFGMPALIVKAL